MKKLINIDRIKNIDMKRIKDIDLGRIKGSPILTKGVCGVTLASLILGAVGISTYEQIRTPGVVEAEEKSTGEASENSTEAKTLETAVSSAISRDNATEKGVSKEETVYVFSDNDGSVKDTVVSDWLKNSDNADLISDVSNLSEIENVKGDENFVQDGDKLTWDANGNDIYYQGKSSDDIPVGVKVSYKLDGKEVSADEIAGKSGRVVIRFDYTNDATTEIDGRDVTVPFTMVTGVMLPTKSFKGVKVSNGQVLSEGNNTIALGYSFPGLEKAIDADKIESDAKKATGKDKSLSLPDYLEVEAEATDFSLDMTMTVALPDVLSEALDTEDTGLDDLADSLNELGDGVDALSDGTQKLKDNSGKLTDGANALSSGAEHVANGAKAINDGLAQLDASVGSKDTQSKLNSLKEGSKSVNTFADGAKSVADGTLELTKTLKSAASGVQTISGQYQQLVTGLCQTLGCQPSALPQMAANRQAVVAQVPEAGQDALNKALIQYETLTPVVNAMAPLASGSESVAQLEAGAKQISQNSSAIKTYTSGVDALIGSFSTMKPAISKLAQGSSKLYTGLAGGDQSLLSGTKALATGIGEYTDGVSKVNDGVSELSDGLGDTDFSSTIDSISDVVESGKAYDTFSGKSGKEESSVKFIIKTDGVK